MMDVRTTLGAIFIGCLASVGLSCIAMVQFVMYLKTYPQDSQQIKMMVILIWILDAIHTSLVCTASWDYVVLNFGRPDIADYIPTSVACTVALTAIITFVVHIFFSSRVFRLSKGNWYLTCPLVLLAFMRLTAAFVSTVKMSHIKSFEGFTVQIGWVLTLGLSLSSAIDILIASSMCLYLQVSRTGFKSMDRVINTIMIYTLNTGALTCVAAIASMICWVTMPGNLIWFGLHFAISKLYANSLLASLNSRRSISENPQLMPDCIHSTSVTLPDSFSMHRRGSRMTAKPGRGDDEDPEKTTKLEINVVRTVEFDVDRGERAQTPGLA